MRDLIPLVAHLLLEAMIDLEELLELQLQKCMVEDTGVSDTLTLVLAIHLQLRVAELRQSTAQNLAVHRPVGLWRLTWKGEGGIRILTLHSHLVDALAGQALLDKVLDHVLELPAGDQL